MWEVNEKRRGGVRFAPSPTGRFHIGNLRTAWISYRWAQHLGLPWVLRFEDIDRPRVAYGALEDQLSDMQQLGLVADPACVYLQSKLRSRHWTLFVRAVELGKVYPCICSRKEVQDSIRSMASAPHLGVRGGLEVIYSGQCRQRFDHNETVSLSESVSESLGWRFKNEADPSGKTDFLVARTDWWWGGDLAPFESTFVPSYQWACAIDDWDGEYSLLVRAWDLESAIYQQRAVQGWLNELEGVRALPAVFHASLVVQDDGKRLEKRTKGVTLPEVLSLGLTASQIVDAFSKSFDFGNFQQMIGPGLISGEQKKEISTSLFLSTEGKA